MLLADGDRLYLQVSPSGTKSWIFRYTLRGRTRDMGLGPYPTFSLAEARQRAHTQRQVLADGTDPIEARDAQRTAQTLAQVKTLGFAECARQYIAAHRKGWSNAKHAEQWESTLATYADRTIGALPAKAVDTAAMLRILEPIWNVKPETASRVRGRIERILDWAKVRGYRTGDNPAKWRGHLDHLLAKLNRKAIAEHHAALPYRLIPEFMERLRAEPGVAARGLEFLILTAARTGEVRGARSEELDAVQALWTVPAERMKAKREHRVPLSSRALEIAASQPAAAYLFRGRYDEDPLSNNTFLKLLGRIGYGGITAHGFRSSFRDWAAETTSFPHEVCEMALAHVIGNKAEAAYRRGDLFEKRRKLMAAWALYCECPARAATVTPLRAAVS